MREIIAYFCLCEVYTFFCWVHNGDRAERPLPSVVIGSYFDVKRREGWEGVVSEDVTRHAGRGDNRSSPRDRAHRPEGDDVAKVLSILQVLRHRLGAKHKTIVILKRIQTEKQTGPSLQCILTGASVKPTQPLLSAITAQKSPQSPFTLSFPLARFW